MMVLCSFIQAIAMAFFKSGSRQVVFSYPRTILLNKMIAIGMIVYLPAFYLNVVAYRFGSLSFLYPFQTSGQVWNILIAFLIFKDRFTVRKLSGIFFIFIGCVLITVSGSL